MMMQYQYHHGKLYMNASFACAFLVVMQYRIQGDFYSGQEDSLPKRSKTDGESGKIFTFSINIQQIVS